MTHAVKLITEAVDFSQNNYLIEEKNGKKEYLIPIIPEVIKKLDHSQMTIFISPMDGLLD